MAANPDGNLFQINNLGIQHCTEFVFSDFSNYGIGIATVLPINLALAIFAVVASFFLKWPAFHGLYAFVTCWWILASFFLHIHCNNWIVYFVIGWLAVTVLYLAFWWPKVLTKPGGVLAWLRFSRLAPATQWGDHDTFWMGKANEYFDMSWGQLIFTLAYLVWVFGTVGERYNFYTTGSFAGYDTVQAAGRAMAHAALRLWWGAEISGHRWGLLWAIFGCPYDRSQAFHKMTGRLAYICMTIHFGIMVNKIGYHPYTFTDPFNFADRPNMWAGLLVWIFTTLLIITSLPFVRRRMFETFYFAHMNFKFMMIIFSLLHYRAYTLPFIITIIASFWIDMGIRFTHKVMMKAQLHSATIVCAEPGNEICRLEISRKSWPSNVANWEPGSFIFLSLGGRDKRKQPAPIPPLAAKFMSPPLPSAVWFHPLTISSPPSMGDKFVVMIKNMGPGSWSGDVCSMCTKYLDLSLVKPMVGGPHGRLSIDPKDYHTVVLCAGGIGVTPMAAIWGEIGLAPHKFPKVKRVVVIWVARSMGVFSAFQEWIDMGNRKLPGGIAFEFRCFLTKGDLPVGGIPPAFPSPTASPHEPTVIPNGKSAMYHGPPQQHFSPQTMYMQQAQPQHSSQQYPSQQYSYVVPQPSQMLAYQPVQPMYIGGARFGSDEERGVEAPAEGVREPVPFHNVKDGALESLVAGSAFGTPQASVLYQGMQVIAGRPDWKSELLRALQGLPDSEYGGIFSCGPSQMMAAVSQAQYSLPRTHLHKEVFEW